MLSACGQHCATWSLCLGDKCSVLEVLALGLLGAEQMLFLHSPK